MYNIEQKLRKNTSIDRHQLAKLHTFEVCARYLSFSMAAEELCITASAVSHQITKLESDLGFQLFKRSHRRIILTEEGIQLFHTLQHSLKLLNKEIFEIRNQEISGTLTIYARPSLAQSWLIPAIAGFNQKYPFITLNILTGNEVIDFNRYKVDLAIYYDDLYSENLHHYELMPESVIPVCSPEYAEKHKLYGNPKSLEHCLLLHDGQAWHYNSDFEEWESWLTYFNYSLNLNQVQSMVFDCSNLALTAAINHIGIAMGRKQLITPYLVNDQLITPFKGLEKPCNQRYYIVTPYKHNQNIHTVIHWLKKHMTF
ncbi:DNA-binding transcriptional regulator DsdC [Histophilus somni]|uniref:DNA-binding transcriptional regulator DsdC n=1 Tax=Histophilus somni TaxID=731 RepID=A0AAX2S4G8_HISSO|nr:DNA-binding transcriptional regulator DsdC [Histophilus somni]QEH09736.1 DNA-binding transcriptional regulator DsdC [Histophilus somni]QEH11610.1 DNA-binding transcriptional regulator DsdC [Histophilus somni]QEH18813.1 DNA-binding transcriptional regulator DsdC [Histophilus somni]QEH26012.1 DNA-binding transcriptional regulator DsdC [Histophilus somni]QEH26091.1 DNA-binding transcriptional regulator DsdC [Histophilus somni]